MTPCPACTVLLGERVELRAEIERLKAELAAARATRAAAHVAMHDLGRQLREAKG